MNKRTIHLVVKSEQTLNMDFYFYSANIDREIKRRLYKRTSVEDRTDFMEAQYFEPEQEKNAESN